MNVFSDPRGSRATNLVVSLGIDFGAENSSVGETVGTGGDRARGPNVEMLEEEVIEQHPAWLDRSLMGNRPVAVLGVTRTARYGCVS